MHLGIVQYIKYLNILIKPSLKKIKYVINKYSMCCIFMRDSLTLEDPEVLFKFCVLKEQQQLLFLGRGHKEMSSILADQ